MIKHLFPRRTRNASIPALYGMIVAQARAPVFYEDFGVPDTVDGRFDLIVLHAVLLMRRLVAEAGADREIGQGIFDCFCRDMDDNLREMGVGDLAVPRKMRRIAEAFYGRQAAYEAALAQRDDGALATALARNIYSDASGISRGAIDLAAYVRAVVRRLDGCEAEKVSRAQWEFPNPAAMAGVRA